MKALSLWQPWASLIVEGHKRIETRGWPASKHVIGQRIAIAATKTVQRAGRETFNSDVFQRHYRETGLPHLSELPHAAVLGTAVLAACEPIDQEVVNRITPAEFFFGHYAIGRWAWHLEQIERFDPIPVRGAQGLWEWRNGVLEDEGA